MRALSTLMQPDRSKNSNHGWRKGSPGDLSERWLGLRVPSANRPVGQGEGDGGRLRTLTLGLGAWVGA
jgi:hypothetical protein